MLNNIHNWWCKETNYTFNVWIYAEWVKSQSDQSISNQINLNQYIPIIYNHMNIITIKYIQNHTNSINCLQYLNNFI